MTVTRPQRNGYDIVECSICGDSTVLTGRPEWRNAEEEAWRFRHSDEPHESPAIVKARKGKR